MPWTCPACERAFRTRNQWHSCVRHEVDDHFRGKAPAVRAIFDALVAATRDFGGVRVEAVKGSVQLAAASRFAEVVVQAGGLKVGFASPVPLESRRLKPVAQAGPSLYLYQVKLALPGDVDEELVGWLREAHARARRA